MHLDQRFVTILGISGRTLPGTNTVIYEINSSTGTGNVLSSLVFDLAAVSSGANLTQFQDSNKQVKSVVKVMGTTTGVTLNTIVTVDYSS